eukprot:TRINITY_DN192_c0_g1_i1.p1 TRINITY_DN192_c0_g1~~TRINITY_DN192_c0_g1_i1.p1  ORF type:complete len:340 (+),score=58.28 TRINITY_DN192_c0_g1_i1:283-1302(+)
MQGHDTAFVPAGSSAFGVQVTSSATGRKNVVKAVSMASTPASFSPLTASAHSVAVGATTGVAPTPMPVMLPSLCDFGPFSESPAGRKGGKVLVWFRSDLRVHDNPALTHALEEAGTVVPVYCFDPRQFGKTSFGFEKTGRYRAKFLIESVTGLRDSLRKLGSDLVVRSGRPEDTLPELCRRLGVSSVFYHQEVTYEEQEVEQALAESLKAAGVEFKPFWANTLYHSEDLPFAVQDMPDVYTAYREAVESGGEIRSPLPSPTEMPTVPTAVKAGPIPSLKELGLAEPVGEMAAVGGVGSFTGGKLRRCAACRRTLRRWGEGSGGGPQVASAQHVGSSHGR